MKKVFIWFLITISSLSLFLRFSRKGVELFLGTKPSGISVLSEPSEATVYLDGREVGKTPYEDKNLDVKDYIVKLEKGEASWQGKVKLTPGTMSVVNRDLSKDQTSSAGETLTLDEGSGVTIISNPSDADVEIDGKSYGKTPITTKLDSGEHTILVSHPNYLKRSIRANSVNNFNLTIVTDLALSEADLTTISTPVIKQTQEVLVKETPTGYLRVRDKPSLLGREVGRVAPGDKLILLEEAGDWDRVRLPNNIEGYVSSVYVEKQSQ